MISHVATFIATFLYSGLIRPAPGTWGTLAGVPFAILLLAFGDRWDLLIAATLAFLIGWWAASRHMIATNNQDDPSEIVIDEVAGLWVTYLGAPNSDWVWIVAGFLLFRLFDIWKPGPVGWADRRIKGSLGVMVDDIIAGGMAAACLVGATYLAEVI